MGSHRLGGYCGPCNKKLQDGRKKYEAFKQQEGPPINRQNYMEYGIRFGEKSEDGFFSDQYPCLKDKYALEKERV